MTYVNDKDQTHLFGPISAQDLQIDSLKVWYQKNYDAIALSSKKNKWKKNLKNTTVHIYLGTWCGDSKRYVPQFIKLWDELGLNPDQLNIIALYNGGDRHKQGPNGEEQGKKIHRVPTFIFNQDGKEYARIVERPVTDLETDIAQIALGYPSTPQYAGANYMLDIFSNYSLQEINKDFVKHDNAVFRKCSKSSELNTLGYVLLSAGRLDEALVTFMYNTRINRHDPNVYDSYGEALALKGETEKAIANYEKVIELDPKNEHAQEQLEKLKHTLTEG